MKNYLQAELELLNFRSWQFSGTNSNSKVTLSARPCRLNPRNVRSAIHSCTDTQPLFSLMHPFFLSLSPFSRASPYNDLFITPFSHFPVTGSTTYFCPRPSEREQKEARPEQEDASLSVRETSRFRCWKDLTSRHWNVWGLNQELKGNHDKWAVISGLCERKPPSYEPREPHWRQVSVDPSILAFPPSCMFDTVGVSCRAEALRDKLCK